jgi:hypothetical protein
MKIYRMKLAGRVTVLPTVEYYYDSRFLGWKEITFSWGIWCYCVSWGFQ